MSVTATHRGVVSAMAWEQARAVAWDSARTPRLPIARDLSEALGHALAEPLTALADLPSFDTSAMDGWAVAGSGPWRLCGSSVLAGCQPEPLAGGTAVRVATGAPLPPGATAVLRREDGEVDTLGATLHDRPTGSLKRGRDVRPRGQECRRGEPLLPAGTTVTPAVLGLAAAAGYDRLTVHRRPTVDLLVLGDELIESGPSRNGRVRDALGPLLLPWLQYSGAEVLSRRLVADDFELLLDAIRHSSADVVITTGSTAAGPVDFLHDALDAAGARLLVDSVAVRPGHPMLLARLPPAADGRARRLAGLPGNPLAAVAGTATLAVPLLRRLGGHAYRRPQWVAASTELPGHPQNTRLVPVSLADRAAAPLTFDGPAMLRGLALADGLAVVPPGGLRAGAAVEILAIPGR